MFGCQTAAGRTESLGRQAFHNIDRSGHCRGRYRLFRRQGPTKLSAAVENPEN